MTWPHIACFCGRQATGFGYQRPAFPGAKRIQTCSMRCMKIASKRKGEFSDMALTNAEFKSIEEASPEIGEHLESLGVTDMAAMTYEQWLDHLAFVFEKICEKNADKWADGGVPM